MRYTAEEVKEYLKNYHICCGKVLCNTANEQIEQAMERLAVAVFQLGYEDEELIDRYYIEKDGSLSDLAKLFGCSKNNIAKKLNRAIEKLAQIISDDEPSGPSCIANGSPKYTVKQIRGYLKRMWYFSNVTTHHGIKMDENFIKDIRLVNAALQSLEDIDKQLVLELYKNKEKLSVIGNTYGYSVSGVKYRIGVAIKKICAMLNGDVQQIP